jgi:hypothetical protein
MLHPLRRALIASLIAFHAAMMLCGPCLHAMPGLDHRTGLGLAETRDSTEWSSARQDFADDCPICQLVAQGQLPIEACTVSSTALVARSIGDAAPVADVASPTLPSSPRAPPAMRVPS